MQVIGQYYPSIKGHTLGTYRISTIYQKSRVDHESSISIFGPQITYLYES